RGIGHQQPVDQYRQFQPAAQRGQRLPRPGQQRVGGPFGDQSQPRQEARPPCGTPFLHPPPDAGGVQEQRHPRQRLGRLIMQSGKQSVDQKRREIRSGRQAEDAGGGAGEHHRPSIASASASPSGLPTSHQSPV